MGLTALPGQPSRGYTGSMRISTGSALVITALCSLSSVFAADFDVLVPAGLLEGAGALSRRIDARPAPAVPGSFDYYVLALSWGPSFCRKVPDAMECKTATTKRYDASHLVLHGLWPNKNGDAAHSYGYCGVPEAWQALDKPATWCQMPPLELSDATEESLTTYMPGWSSYLERHEWYKHGICSGLTPDRYFSASAAIIAKVGETFLGRYLAAHVGQTVAAEALFSAFETEFGSGSRGALRLFCSSSGGTATLSEVFVTLKAPLPAGELRDMVMTAENPGPGTCPAVLRIEAPQVP